MVQPAITVESVKISSIATMGISILLGVCGIILLAAARRKRCFLVVSGLAGIPLIVGAIGMALGYSEVRAGIAELGESVVTPSMIQAAFAQARMPLYIGAAGFGGLLLLSLVGMLLCKDICSPKEEEATELVK